ncbi:hypothetical protein DRW03_21380 [Corallococcus sp. H22C18031201]|nr:hypothetical protein DRW03_21380 [Corallococcus sp. H22C18031201]
MTRSPRQPVLPPPSKDSQALRAELRARMVAPVRRASTALHDIRDVVGHVQEVLSDRETIPANVLTGLALIVDGLAVQAQERDIAELSAALEELAGADGKDGGR